MGIMAAAQASWFAPLFFQGFQMQTSPPKPTLQGMTLEAILLQLVEHYGWQKLGQLINIKCFTSNPSIKSSLTFLRKTPWARSKVEELFLRTSFTAH